MDGILDRIVSSLGSDSFDISDMDPMEDEEEDVFIICRCSDKDEHNNDPLGFLGHMQRSRCLQVRNNVEINLGMIRSFSWLRLL